jgi:hypothetical protein
MTGHIPTLFGFRTALKDLYLGKYYTGAAGKNSLCLFAIVYVYLK